MEKKRRTGRTTRMLEEAIRLSREGVEVVVIMPTHDMAREVETRIIPELSNGRVPTGIKVTSPGGVPDFNFRRMDFNFPRKNTEALVDHHTIEKVFASVLNAWERFD